MTSIDSRSELMTGREKLEELAAKRGLSLKTAKRYLEAGVDLNDPDAVEEHKQKIRSRRGVSKLSRRSLIDSTEDRRLGAYIEEVENIIWQCHFSTSMREVTEFTLPIVEQLWT